MRSVLVAGIGNIFFGDDGFGCEVAAELAKRSWPDQVTIVDFGIRAYDLAYAIMDRHDATILIDAAPRGEKPGTVYLLDLTRTFRLGKPTAAWLITYQEYRLLS